MIWRQKPLIKIYPVWLLEYWLNLIFAKKWDGDHDSNILSVIDNDIFSRYGWIILNWIRQSHLDWSGPGPRPQRRGWWQGWRPADRKWRRRGTWCCCCCCCCCWCVVFRSWVWTAAAAREHRQIYWESGGAVQATVHQLNNPGFLTFLRRLLEIRDKCLVKSNSIYNPQNSANPLGWEQNYPPTPSKLITLCGLCGMFWSHLWVHMWKYFAALAINS